MYGNTLNFGAGDALEDTHKEKTKYVSLGLNEMPQQKTSGQHSSPGNQVWSGQEGVAISALLRALLPDPWLHKEGLSIFCGTSAQPFLRSPLKAFAHI